MKLQFLLVVLICTGLVAGCRALVEKSTAQSYPVQAGFATTNDPAVIAYLNAAKAVNMQYNPTPSREPIDLLISTLTVLTSVIVGYAGRHFATKPTIT